MSGSDEHAPGSPGGGHQDRPGHAGAHAHGHAHGHTHSHAHDAHAHGHAYDSERRVLWAMLLTGGFMVVEVVGGLISGSLALLADAGHMVTDVAALGLAFAAFRVGRRGHDARRTYGYHRFQVLAAFVNGLALIAIIAWIAWEAVRRMLDPVDVLSNLMLAVAGAGLVVNVATFAILHGGDRANINIRGAALHVLGDLLGSVAAIVAAVVIMITGWMPIDPILSLLVAVLVLRSAWGLIRSSGHILLEGAPDWLNVDDLRSGMIRAVPDVVDVHHVHTWMITAERPMMTLHVEVEPTADHHAVLVAVRRYIRDELGVTHSTVQIEAAGCVDHDADLAPTATGAAR
ncbi:MAG: cation diffusion facilitator family transporter [Rhodospirillales bacterium]|nr:cation diffusion facilitator family transporter [Rhodospirillales bacterium]